MERLQNKYVYFQCNLRTLREYPALWAYTRDIYQIPGVAGTVDREHITRHYHVGHGHSGLNY